jgi:hypothetical protein
MQGLGCDPISEIIRIAKTGKWFKNPDQRKV